ncbi:SusC/RagA family TonB-linked outer membrane protein [Ferruginibacter albus]|uniref:SusC/RagA family TonB-linked outer membrane protein n=1 Tax=Ferruginibacter albus TaxID=2875540 RepID=UPI001CC8044F|nr:SusC/RagA family TonB-linked outer membrane protein [Ferruginibacter albus]UAY50846.1 SusC/RagA family TonB-linked outer membrane protein [Ferruginibacter albus]
MKKVFRVLLVVAFFLPLGALAQQRTVTGKITNSKDGAPLSGVTVTAGSGAAKVATTTNDAGEYSITVPDKAKEITFSYVGFGDITEKINGRSTISTRLSAASADLGEVVVVGYGTQKKVNLTGSVATLKGSELVTTKNENTYNMLTGKIPGLRMVQKTAEPGSYENSYDIRGYGGAPLVVIDGIPGGALERMDPNEIESISVLKDAAAAVYGANAASGVILVTTKKGANKDGKLDITYSFNRAIQQFLGMPQGVGPVDYMMLTNEKAKRDMSLYADATAPLYYGYYDLQPWINGTAKGADWIDAAFNTTSPQVQHNINITGGNDKISTFTSLGYTKQDGLLKSNALDYTRWNLRSNINVKINNRLRAQLLISGYSDTKNQPFQPLWNIFKYAWNALPINQIYANNNPYYLNVMPDNVNPVAAIDPSQVGYVKSTSRQIQAQGSLEYDIPGIKGLRAKGAYTYAYYVSDNTSYRNVYDLYSFHASDSTYVPSLVNGSGALNDPILNRAYGTSNSTVMQLSLNYAASFKKVHNVTALLLYEELHGTSDNIFAQRYLPLPLLYNLFQGIAGTGEIGSANQNGVGESAKKSIVGRVNYDYKGRYLAEFSFRRDAFNQFYGNKQWIFTPGVSVGWRISDEPFFKNNISPKFISNLKLRASYAEIADATDGRINYQYLQGYDYPSVDPADNKVLGYMFNGQFVTGLTPRPTANPDLSWSPTIIRNIGVDFSLFNGKVDGTVEYYNRDIYGVLAPSLVTIPGTTGQTQPLVNADSRETRGIEVSLAYKNRIGKDLGLLLAGNFSYSRSHNLVHTEDGVFGNEYLAWKSGQADRYTNILWGTDYGGQYSSYSQIYNSPVNNGSGNNTIVPGDYYMQDWNGDGVINGDDYHPIATQDLPLINFGFNIGITFKSFDVTALFAGAAAVWTEYGEQQAMPLMYNGSALSKFLDSWHTVNPTDNIYDPNTQWIGGKYPSMGYDYSQINNSTKGILNASYVRLKTLEFGYTLPKRLLNKVGIKNCRVYVNGYNLLTFTGLEDGVDPEHPGTFPNASFNDALGGYKYPLNRTFNIGGNITF